MIQAYQGMRGRLMTARSSDVYRLCVHVLLMAVLGSACIRLQPRPALTEPPRLAFKEARYDGRTLSGLLLVEARAPTVMDRRLVEDIAVGLASVRDGETGQSISPWIADTLLPEASGDDLITLRPGEWFGREVSFLVFADARGSAGGPSCIDFELFLILPEAGVKGPAAIVSGRACQETPAPAAPVEPQAPRNKNESIPESNDLNTESKN